MGASVATSCFPDGESRGAPVERVSGSSCHASQCEFVCEELADACHVAAGATYREVFLGGGVHLLAVALDDGGGGPGRSATAQTDRCDDLLRLASRCEARSLARLYNEAATGINLKRTILQLGSRLSAGDSLVFVYSGRREMVAGRGAFCLADSSGACHGAACWMLDDDFAQILAASVSPKVPIFFLMDSIGSAGSLDLWTPSWASTTAVQLANCRPEPQCDFREAPPPALGVAAAVMAATERLRLDGELEYSVGKLYETMLLLEGCAKDLTVQCALGTACEAMVWPLAPVGRAYKGPAGALAAAKPAAVAEAEAEVCMSPVASTRTPSDSSGSQVRSSGRREAERRAVRLAAEKAAKQRAATDSGAGVGPLVAAPLKAPAAQGAAKAGAGATADSAGAGGCTACCPSGHRLQAFTTPVDGYTCSGCTRPLEAGSVLHGCRSCDFDVCGVCLGSGVGTGTAAEAPPEDAAVCQSLCTITEESALRHCLAAAAAEPRGGGAFAYDVPELPRLLGMRGVRGGAAEAKDVEAGQHPQAQCSDDKVTLQLPGLQQHGYRDEGCSGPGVQQTQPLAAPCTAVPAVMSPRFGCSGGGGGEASTTTTSRSFRSGRSQRSRQLSEDEPPSPSCCPSSSPCWSSAPSSSGAGSDLVRRGELHLGLEGQRRRRHATPADVALASLSAAHPGMSVILVDREGRPCSARSGSARSARSSTRSGSSRGGGGRRRGFAPTGPALAGGSPMEPVPSARSTQQKSSSSRTVLPPSFGGSQWLVDASPPADHRGDYDKKEVAAAMAAEASTGGGGAELEAMPWAAAEISGVGVPRPGPASGARGASGPVTPCQA